MVKARKIIDIQTLEVFESLKTCADSLGVSKAAVFNAILYGGKCKGRKFEYLDEWLVWTTKEKERHTAKNNIYFL